MLMVTSRVLRITFYFCYFSLGQGLKSCPAQKRKFLLVMKLIVSWYNNHAVPYHKLKLTWLACSMKPSLSSSATISLPMSPGLSFQNSPGHILCRRVVTLHSCFPSPPCISICSIPFPFTSSFFFTHCLVLMVQVRHKPGILEFLFPAVISG